jgi:hypothetical protein
MIIKDILIDAQIEPVTSSKAAVKTGMVAFHKTKGKMELSDGTNVRHILDSLSKVEIKTDAVVDADYIITDNDNYCYINVTTSAVDRTITLPTLADNQTRLFIIRKLDSGVGKVIIDGEGAETIDGVATYDLNLQGDSVILVGDVASWSILSEKKALIQDYTAVGSVGSANQQFAGRDYTLAELQAYFGAKLVSFYKFGAGALGTDELGAYDYTLGAAAKEPSSGIGIMGVADTAISFDGGDYATNATKFDDFTTRFSGAGKGLIHSFWLTAPTDGQPAATSTICFKRNSAANDYYDISLRTSGLIQLETRGNSATTKKINSTTVLPNDANTVILHCVAAWDTTYGLRLYINSKLEAQDPTATTLMVDGTTTDFFFGGSDATPANPFTGRIMNEIIVNDVCTQAMVDFLYATTIPLPTVLQGKDFDCKAFMKPSVAGNVSQVWCDEVQRDTARLLISGGTRRTTDYYKLVGEV